MIAIPSPGNGGPYDPREAYRGSLLWGMVIAAALACCGVVARRSSAQTSPDAAKPIPGFSAKQLGPSVDDVIDYFHRKDQDSPSSPDVVE